MIVNPQFFNYRLIIGSLVIVIVSLVTLGYLKYNTLKKNQEFITQENKLVENELSEMISSYEKMVVENQNINLELEKTKQKISRILDSVKTLESNVSLISSYKKQIEDFKAEHKEITSIVNDLKSENITVNNKEKLKNNVQKKLDSNSENYTKVESPKSSLTVSSFTAEAVKRVTRKRIIKTKYANNAKQIHVCFTLEDSTFTQEEYKDIYIQILNPKNNIIADKGVVNFGKSSLIYTEKLGIDYDNKTKKVCSLIKTDASDALVKGTYFVSIYHKAVRLGNTTIELK